jgi:Tfp pilus assembly protein PilE
LVFPLIATIGILAAVALPAYQSYVMKAKAAAVHQAQ